MGLSDQGIREMLSRMREVQRMEAERAELQLEKAKRELRQKFGERKAGEGCVAVNAERCEVYKYEVFMRLFIFPSRQVCNP